MTETNLIVQTTNSIIPSIKEAERFIQFLNNRFSLGLSSNLIVTIEGISPRAKGYYMANNQIKGYTNTIQELNTITLNSIYLKETPYETIAHEVGHFYNNVNNIKDCSSNQYHNKNFKLIAERLLLKVEKTSKGFSQTTETPEFKLMLEEFTPDNNAFHISQHNEEKEKKPSRNLLYMCDCGVKVRTAKNQDKPFMAICEYCNTKFIEVIK